MCSDKTFFKMFCLSFVFIVLLVPFGAGGTSGIEKTCGKVVLKKGLQTIRKNTSKLSFGMDLGVICSNLFNEHVICV